MNVPVTLCLVLFFAACGGNPANTRTTGGGDDEIGCFQEFGKDAPGTIAAAVLVETDELTGCLGDSTSDEADAFRFRVLDSDMRDTLNHFEVTPSKSLSLCASLFGGADQELQRECSKEAGEPLRLWVVAAVGSQLRLKLEPAQALSGTESYSVRLEQEIIEDADEPNEYLEDATALQWGQAHEAYFIASAGGAPAEIDIYRLSLENAGAVHLEISKVPAEIPMMVELLDADGKRLKRVVAKNKGDSMKESFELSTGGVYFLRLSNALGTFIPRKAGVGPLPGYLSTPYSITVNWEP